MNINLIKAKIEDAEEIHKMQLLAFKELLDRYQDYEISPGAEKLERVIERIKQDTTDYFIIKYDNRPVGAIRIRKLYEEGQCRISPIFIIPEYQNKGIAQKVFQIIEEKYKPENGWNLDTILEEKGNCHLYERMGYKQTGKIEKIKEGMHIVFYEKSK